MTFSLNVGKVESGQHKDFEALKFLTQFRESLV